MNIDIEINKPNISKEKEILRINKDLNINPPSIEINDSKKKDIIQIPEIKKSNMEISDIDEEIKIDNNLDLKAPKINIPKNAIEKIPIIGIKDSINEEKIPGLNNIIPNKEEDTKIQSVNINVPTIKENIKDISLNTEITAPKIEKDIEISNIDVNIPKIEGDIKIPGEEINISKIKTPKIDITKNIENNRC